MEIKPKELDTMKVVEPEPELEPTKIIEQAPTHSFKIVNAYHIIQCIM